MPKSVYIKNYKVSKFYDNSLTLDGGNDYVALPNLGFVGNVNITVESWIYCNNLAHANTIFSFSIEGTSRAAFGFSVIGSPSAGLIQLFNWVDDCNSAVGMIQAFKWIHVACTYEASTRIRRVFVDGVQVVQSTAAANLNFTNASYSIGKRVSNVDYFEGYLQDVRIWNVVRTAQQISESKNKKLVGNETGLIAYYKLNEGSGTTAIDSKSGLNGTLTNGPTYTPIYSAPIYQTVYKGNSEYEFGAITSNINNGYGDVTFTIPKKFDDFGLEYQAGLTDTKVGLNGYKTKIIVYDDKQTLGQTIFQGEMVSIDRTLAKNENVSILCCGPLFRLEKTPLKVAGSHIVTFTGLDVAEIFKQIIASYNGQQHINTITYTASSIQTTSSVATVTFNNATCLDALKTVFKLTGASWVWYLDVDSVMYLRTITAFPNPVNHFFVMGKDIISVGIKENKLEIINDVAIWDGASNAGEYRDNFSLETYGLFFEKKRDDRLSNSLTIDNAAKRVVEQNGIPNLQVEIEVLDSEAGGYDLELIKVGDTCKVLNVSSNAGLKKIMVITKKVDYLDKAVLTISDVMSYTSRELYNLKKDQEQVNYDAGPSTYRVIV